MANLSFGGGATSSYFDRALQRQVFSALGLVSSPGLYTTAAGTGGPLLWNNSTVAGPKRVNAVILAVGVGISVASTAAVTIGLTGNSGQIAAPTSTTAIDAVQNMYISGNAPACNTYRIGTVANAGNFFLPTHSLGTGAITTTTVGVAWVDLGGSIVVPPGSWVAVAASAVGTSAVLQVGLLWTEVPT